MPVFVWEGKTRGGDARSGEMNATSQKEVTNRLRQQQISPSKIAKKRGEGLSSIKIPGLGGVPAKNLVIFTRQFATMIDAGLPLVQCLELLGNAEPHKAFKGHIAAVRKDIEAGSTLSDAMAKHPAAFDHLYVSLVAAGEKAGILDTVMTRLAMQLEKSAKLKRKVKGAFTYPTIVFVIAVLVVIVLLYKVIPTFAAMFESMAGDTSLPGPTLFVMGISDFVQDYIVWIVLGGIGVFMFVNFIMSYEPTRRGIDKAVLKMPLIGPLIRKAGVARFTRTLGTMVSSGVPIVDALEIVSKTSGNYTIEGAIMYVREKISEGQNMVDPLLETGIFPNMVVQMIGVGENTGALDTMLNKIADFYEDEVDAAVENLTALLEPIMMVGLGGVIGGLLIAMYLPIFTLAGSIKAE